jgi:hypothetical protein
MRLATPFLHRVMHSGPEKHRLEDPSSPSNAALPKSATYTTFTVADWATPLNVVHLADAIEPRVGIVLFPKKPRGKGDWTRSKKQILCIMHVRAASNGRCGCAYRCISLLPRGFDFSLILASEKKRHRHISSGSSILHHIWVKHTALFLNTKSPIHFQQENIASILPGFCS